MYNIKSRINQANFFKKKIEFLFYYVRVSIPTREKLDTYGKEKKLLNRYVFIEKLKKIVFEINKEQKLDFLSPDSDCPNFRSR